MLTEKYAGQVISVVYLLEGYRDTRSRKPQKRMLLFTEKGSILPIDDDSMRYNQHGYALGVQLEPPPPVGIYHYWTGKNIIPNKQLVQVITPDGKVWGKQRRRNYIALPQKEQAVALDARRNQS